MVCWWWSCWLIIQAEDCRQPVHDQNVRMSGQDQRESIVICCAWAVCASVTILQARDTDIVCFAEALRLEGHFVEEIYSLASCNWNK